MKIASYGTKAEKAILCGLFLGSAGAAAGVLHREGILAYPYLALPLYLLLCALLVACLPRAGASGHPFSRWLYRAMPALLLMSAIFLCSSLSVSLDSSASPPDFFFHFAEFFALGILAARMVAPNGGGGRPSLSVLLVSAGLVLGFALLDELHQDFVPGRDPSALDFLSDAAGGLLGILAYPVLFASPPTSP